MVPAANRIDRCRRWLSFTRHDAVIKPIDDQQQDSSPVEARMTGQMLSIDPTIDPAAELHETTLGAYCEVGARTILHEVTMDDYSYVVNDAQITYTTIGKFCSIAAMTRINPGNHPMQRGFAGPLHLSRQRVFPWRRRRC
jgi:carbonic anhydrase/acetyltransferase-like protein (isoleucine patch superfamily)